MSLPLECAFAYNTPLQGCSMEDFGEGKMCSSTCIDNILAVETKIQDSCALARTGSNSLLDQAQQGRLTHYQAKAIVNHVCYTYTEPDYDIDYDANYDLDCVLNYVLNERR
ncbi:hypothetical protein E5D57_006752 [Metarhizium anisopliae]|nr:hypothetical protein E5D57_006752 [Metarhizium anisopliae]